ncbi:MAG: phosphoenolpyruvate synthase [Myxococcales bacterium]|nr:phosphoenolpyruvate synthase [Myxococcales bacterium]
MLVTRESTPAFARREAGGKGYNLYLLSREGLPVPKWVVLGKRYFARFVAATGIETTIRAILDETLADDRFAEAERRIREAIVEADLPGEVREAACRAYRGLDAPSIAVRSSAVGEDSAQHSFAGQLSSFLYVESEADALRYLKECWASAYSGRGLAYRLQQGIDLGQPIEVAVVFQEMVDAEKAGVLFTIDPITQDPTRATINAVYGVGEGLVSGKLDADTYVIAKSNGDLLESEIVEKTTRLERRASGELAEVEVAVEHQTTPALSSAELRRLAALARQIEGFYRWPQDVEWAFRDGAFYIVQSRPVTTLDKAFQGLLYIWDNSNIIESYGGITLPLTFGFAHFVYHQVYIQLCEILLIPHSEIRNMDFLRNMLGSFYGRVYYNLLNWYKLISILPGFRYNRGFMETMMGTSESLADEIADRIKPPASQETVESKLRRAVSGVKFAYFHFTIQTMVDDFMRYFHRVWDEYRHKPYERMPADEIYRNYQELEEKLLRRWHAPIVNDFLTMVHFGLLKKLTGQWLADAGDTLHNDLLCGEGNLESAEPTKELMRMAAEVDRDPPLRRLLLETAAEDCMEALAQSPHSAFRQRVGRYIDRFGFRCMSEMKLEQKDLHQDPSFLFVCLKNYLRGGQTDLEAYESREKEIRRAAEEKVRQTLGGVRRWVYFWSLEHARKAVKNRENTRFCRTRIYGVVRAMFYGIGNDYTARGIISRPEEIFYLTLHELKGSLEGTCPAQNLAELIEARKREYERYQEREPAPRFLTRGPVYWQNQHFPAADDGSELGEVPEGCLKGLGCCPGIVEGTVKVVLSPSDDLELNGEILVTWRTDPGWIPLYPSASALLVERGGLLSHSAIVAREMGLPTIVGVKNLTQTLESGMRVRINGESGLIEILEDEAAPRAQPIDPRGVSTP